VSKLTCALAPWRPPPTSQVQVSQGKPHLCVGPLGDLLRPGQSLVAKRLEDVARVERQRLTREVAQRQVGVLDLPKQASHAEGSRGVRVHSAQREGGGRRAVQRRRGELGERMDGRRRAGGVQTACRRRADDMQMTCRWRWRVGAYGGSDVLRDLLGGGAEGVGHRHDVEGGAGGRRLVREDVGVLEGRHLTRGQ
jgi:hypothetical protein